MAASRGAEASASCTMPTGGHSLTRCSGQPLRRMEHRAALTLFQLKKPGFPRRLHWESLSRFDIKGRCRGRTRAQQQAPRLAGDRIAYADKAVALMPGGPATSESL